MLNEGVICKSISLYVLFVVIVRKKDKSIRFCVDYRVFNLKIVKDVYLLLYIEDSLDILNGVKYFSKIDLI